MTWLVVSDVTPNRCTVVSLHDHEEDAIAAAESADTGVNGMPAEVMRTESTDITPGMRAHHSGDGVARPSLRDA